MTKTQTRTITQTQQNTTSGQPNPAPNPSVTRISEHDRCRPNKMFIGIALVILGLGIATIGVLSILSHQYPSLSALSMPLEGGLIFTFAGQLLIGLGSYLIHKARQTETSGEQKRNRLANAVQGRIFIRNGNIEQS